MFEWLRCVTFSWTKLRKTVDAHYPQQGAVIIQRVSTLHEKLCRRLESPTNPAITIELLISEWFSSDNISAHQITKKPAHKVLMQLMAVQSNTSNRLQVADRKGKSKVVSKPDSTKLIEVFSSVYFPYLDKSLKEATKFYKFPPEIYELLLQNLQAITLSLAWTSLLRAPDNTIDEIVTLWAYGNFILTLEGNFQSAEMLALPRKNR